MQVETQLAINAASLIATMGGAYAVIKYRLDRDEKERDKQLAEDTKLHDTLFDLIREVKGMYLTHEKESSTIRLDYEKRFGRHDGNIEVIQSQYAEILKRLDGIDRKVGKIEDNQDK